MAFDFSSILNSFSNFQSTMPTTLNPVSGMKAPTIGLQNVMPAASAPAPTLNLASGIATTLNGINYDAAGHVIPGSTAPKTTGGTQLSVSGSKTFTTPNGAIVDSSGKIISAGSTGGGDSGLGGGLNGQVSGSNTLSGIISQIEALTPEQRQFLGLGGETAEQKTQREAMQASLQKLISLQTQLAEAGAPNETLKNLDAMIDEQGKALQDLTPSKFLETQSGLKSQGITQAQLLRETAARREPIAGALADMLISRSKLGAAQEVKVGAIQGQIEGIGNEIGLREAISKLSAPKMTLPAGVQTEVFKSAFPGLGGGGNTEVVDVNGRKILINSQTGQTIRDLGSSKTGGGDSSGLINAVLANPALFNQLTPTQKGVISPQLYAMGFTQFGKPLSDTAIQSLTQSQTAIAGLNDLRATILGNEQYIGPISGLAALNPWSKARQVQAEVNLVRQRVGKALEGGVLRKEDEEKYKKILATLTDTPDTAISKIDNLLLTIQRDIDTYSSLQSDSGRNVPASVGGLNSLFNSFITQ